MPAETILILDFGSQYTQLIARKIRELNVYCEIHPFGQISNLSAKMELVSDMSERCRLSADKSLRQNGTRLRYVGAVPSFSGQISNLKGIILSGSPFSVRQKNSPQPLLKNIRGKIPVLGICYGAQLLAHQGGGKVQPSKHREYGRANLSFVNNNSPLFKNLSLNSQVWMSHSDTIVTAPGNFEILARTPDVKYAGFQVQGEKTYGIQFHPEVFHTTEGMKVLQNFVVGICGCLQTWTASSFIETTIEELRRKIGNAQVVMALSGGVDSTVAATLLHRAIGRQLHCIFVDNGLLRKNEFRNVLHSYKDMGLNVKAVDAKKNFYKALKGKKDPEAKRKAIGKIFIEVFEKEVEKINGTLNRKSKIARLNDTRPFRATFGREVGQVNPKSFYLGQGTIYPDVIESVSVKGPSATIKSHHNVGGLPRKMKLKVVEPLNTLFKDEVRKVGKELGTPSGILGRHPFPGPGLGIRILGEVSKEKVRILQEADNIFIEELKKNNLYDKVWQAAVILLPVQTVGVMGDERTYQHVVVLRAVTSTDGMTADWCRLPESFLANVSNAIINNVKGINRVVYDISSKPPATIEWE